MTDTEHEYDEHGNLLWINTDKYEWDSKCRMVVIDGKLYQRGSNGDYLLSLHDEPVAQIVADAPLLLEEVKRLSSARTGLSSARTVFQTPWTKSEHLGKEHLYSYRIQFYEETLNEVEEWRGEDGWYTAYFMVSDHGTKELDGSNEFWDADGGVHWPSEEERASRWIHYCFPAHKRMTEYLKEMIE